VLHSPFLIALAFATAATVAPAAPARAEHCNGALFDTVAVRLRAIEAEQPVTSDDYLRRSKELTSLLAEPNALLWQGTSDACPGGNRQTQLQAAARERVFLLWGKMIALGAVDGPVFPSPYRHACSRFDGSNLQLDFIRAWLERLDDRGAGFSRTEMWRALDADFLYAHAEQLARDRANRLRVTVLPSLNSDEDAWLQANEAARSRFAAGLPRGTRCGILSGLWGLERAAASNVAGRTGLI
jgi:hypothetical protein